MRGSTCRKHAPLARSVGSAILMPEYFRRSPRPPATNTNAAYLLASTPAGNKQHTGVKETPQYWTSSQHGVIKEGVSKAASCKVGAISHRLLLWQRVQAQACCRIPSVLCGVPEAGRDQHQSLPLCLALR